MAASAGVGAGAVNGEGLKSGQKATSVSVDDSETWVESKRYTVYKVVVRKADKAYFVFRRCVSIYTSSLLCVLRLVCVNLVPVEASNVSGNAFLLCVTLCL